MALFIEFKTRVISRTRGKRWLHAFLGILALSCGTALPERPIAALAGETVQETSVTGRSRPEHDPAGIRTGSFFLYPSLAVDVVHDDNIFAAPTGKTGDTLTRTTAGAQVISSWSRHALSVGIGARNTRYSAHGSENHTNYWGRSAWRMDIRRDIDLSGTVSAERLHESRGAAGSVPDATKPAAHDKYSGSLFLNKRFTRWTVRFGGHVERLDYHDVTVGGGNSADRDIRDQTTYTAVFRQSYEFSPGYHVFSHSEINRRRNRGHAGTGNRDSGGHETRAGLALEIPGIMAGEVSLGYLDQDYSATGFRDTRSVAASGSMVWNPTRLATLTLKGERKVVDTIFNNTSSRLDSSVSGQIDYEILRNLVASPGLSYRIEDYQGDGREDRTLKATFRLRYIFSRNIDARAFYEYTGRDSASDLFDYHKTLVGAGLELKF